MNLFKSTEPSHKLLERRKKLRAMGRTRYALYFGALGWGIPVFLITTLWRWHDEYGWYAPPRPPLFSESIRAAVRLAIWLTMGYFLGLLLYKQTGSGDSTEDSVPNK